MRMILVALGGFFGSTTRFYLSILFNKHVIGTWIVNLSGSLLLGVLVALQQIGMLSEWLWFLLGIGFCGAYTTFSTFGYETFTFLQTKNYLQAIAYVLRTVGLTLLFVFILTC